MSSYKIHVIGLAPISPTEDRLYYAMSRVEMVQAMAKAAHAGKTITRWYSQTGVGDRILGSSETVTTEEITDLLPKLSTCPVCDGYGCICCNYAGIAPRNYHHRWQDWQLANIRAAALASAEVIP